MSHQGDSGLPPLTVAVLRESGMQLPTFEAATAVLGRSRGAKWHVPVPGGKRWGHCQHAPDGPGDKVVLIEVWGVVCKKCQHSVDVPPPVRAAWKAAAAVVSASQALSRHRDSTSPRTWLGYARALEDSPAQQDQAVSSLLAEAGSDLALDGDAQRIASAWEDIIQRWEEFLRSYRETAPSADHAVRASAAAEQVLTTGAVRQEGRLLAAIVGDGSDYGPLGRPYDIAGLAVEAWKSARGRGDSAEQSLDLALRIVAGRLAGKPVRDVSLLPRPAHTAYSGECSPALWAEREFAHIWQEAVCGWVEMLEQAHASASAHDHSGRRLILIQGWPLTCDEDRDLSYLAQFPQVGAAVHAGRRYVSDSWGQAVPRKSLAVVLAVPEFASVHASELTGRPRGGLKVTPGPAVGEAGPLVGRQAEDLLRLAYPFLQSDAAADGARPRPTRAVLDARARARPTSGNVVALRTGQDENLSIWSRISAFRDGHRAWVPDDTASGTEADGQLGELLDHCHQAMVRVVVETGRRPTTQLYQVYGALEGIDRKTKSIAITPAGDHDLLPIPLHRVVSITGHRDDVPAEGWSNVPQGAMAQRV